LVLAYRQVRHCGPVVGGNFATDDALRGEVARPLQVVPGKRLRFLRDRTDG
jgi:hypothetical protein